MTPFILAFALFVASVPASADEAPPVLALSASEASSLRAAEHTGAAIYRHDKAAAHATDALMKTAFKDDRRLRGWVTEVVAHDVVVTFIDGTPAALYSVTVSDGGAIVGDVRKYDSPRALTAYEAGASTARNIAAGTEFKKCSANYNTVVLPADSGATNKWHVYLLPGTTKSGILPVGGAYRFDIEGGKLTAQRSYTRGCLDLPLDPQAKALMLTHLLDPTPTETHVFWSMWARLPLLVGIPDNADIWLVDRTKISLFERGVKKN